MAIEQLPTSYDPNVEADPNQRLSEILDEYEWRIVSELCALQNAPGCYSLHNPPAGWQERNSSCAQAVELLRNGGYDLTHLSRFAHLQRQALYNNGKMGYANADLLGNLQQLGIPRSYMLAAFNAEPPNGSFHQYAFAGIQLYSFMHDPNNREAVAHCIYFLQDAYRMQRPSDLLQASDDPFMDSMRQFFLSDGGMQTLYEVEVTAHPEQLCNKDGLPNRELALRQREWLRHVIMRSTVITDPEIADGYAYALSRVNLSDGKVVAQLLETMGSLGEQKLAILREFAGIYPVNYYSMKQLERMIKVAQGDKREIARLKNKEVVVTFVNRMGDHNGALSLISRQVDDNRGDTVFFEIQSAVDMYRAMARLRERGIRPSTLVCAAHAVPGAVSICAKPPIGATDGQDSVMTIHTPAYADYVNRQRTKRETDKNVALHNMHGFSRLVEEYMQPGWGGVRTIVVIACDAATSETVRAMDGSDDTVVEAGRVSIIDRLAHDLAAHGIQSETWIYGAPAPVIPVGIRHSIVPHKYEGSKKLPFDAVKVMVSRGSVLGRQPVRAMPIRRPS